MTEASVPVVPVKNNEDMRNVEGGDKGSILEERGWRRRQVIVMTPPIPAATGIGVGTGAGWLGVALGTGNLDPAFVWPSVVLVGLGMAYDLGRRFLAKVR
ncbi:hypothetical protein ACFWJ5_41675 [Streptomyces qaidamensis]|uniref:hypothetical protein n=1 Tax=Streptomyces qaidamensis TaxID=1783515 RepID=UPI00365E11AA